MLIAQTLLYFDTVVLLLAERDMALTGTPVSLALTFQLSTTGCIPAFPSAQL